MKNDNGQRGLAVQATERRAAPTRLRQASMSVLQLAAFLAFCLWGSTGEAQEAAPRRTLKFGSREVGGAIERQTLEVLVERADGTGRKIEMRKFVDQMHGIRESYANPNSSADWSQDGDQLSFKVRPSASRTITIDFDGSRVSHLNEGLGQPTSPSIPGELADPLVLQETLIGSWQLMFDLWLARRKGNPPTDANGQALHPLAQLEFDAIAPSSMTLHRFNFVVTGDEKLRLGKQLVPVTRIEATRSNPKQGAVAMIMSWTFWLDAQGVIVRVLKRKQPSNAEEIESYNLDYKPRFAGTITQAIDVPLEGAAGAAAVRKCFYSTNDLASVLGTDPKAMPGIVLVNDAADRGLKIMQRTSLEMARTGIRALTLREGTDSTTEPGYLKVVWEKFVAMPGVDGKKSYLLTTGDAARRGAELAKQIDVAGWIVVNGTLLEAHTIERPDIPILVVYGDQGSEMELADRRRCAEALSRDAAEGRVQVKVLPQVNGDMRLLTDGEPGATLAAGYLRALSRWFRGQLK